jgi:hypothetical protein
VSEPAGSPPPAAPPRGRLPFGLQVAAGFFGPGVLAFVLWLVAAGVTHGTKSLFVRGALDLVAIGLTLAAWVGLFRLSGRAGWKGVRLGLFLLVAAGVAWVAGCFALARFVLR